MKKLLACISVLVLSLGLVCALTACGGEDDANTDDLDYTTATYAQLKEVKWDTKTVKYQYLNDRFEGYGSSWPVCLNLYEDGTAASWQATVTGFHVTHWAIQNKYVIWDFYGTWETNTDGAITLKMKGEGYDVVSDFGTTTSPESLTYTLMLEEGKGQILDYACIASVGVDIKGAVVNDGTVHYSTFEAFFNSYKNDYAEE